MTKVEALLSAIQRADAWVVNEGPILGNLSDIDEPNGNPEHVVTAFGWIEDDEGNTTLVEITEGMLERATVESNTIEIDDGENGFVEIKLYRLEAMNIADRLSSLEAAR